jgi:hypothetical protein
MPKLALFVVVTLPLVVACAPPEPEPTGFDVAADFGISDGVSLSYVDSNGLEEAHAWEQAAGADDRAVFDRTARRGGFVYDDGTFQVEASVERGLEIVRFFDCVTRCAEPADPIAFLPWPLEGGESYTTETEVTLSENGNETGTESQRHRFQVGNAESVTVPAGDFEAYAVLWTRTVGEETDSLQLMVVPGTGIVVSEGFDGSRFELQ